MNGRTLVDALSISVLILVSGCGTVTPASHQNYAIFKNVPRSEVTAIKKSINKASVKNLELPTQVPYKITSAHCPNPASSPGLGHNITIYIGDKLHSLEIQATSNPSNKPVNKSNVVMMNEQVTKLSDGTQAVYGHNEHSSQLSWAENGVRYFLGSIKKGNKPDLSEQQLIRIADSFQ